MHTMLVTEVSLRNWLERNPREGQAFIPELVGRLVAASSKNPRAFEFPWGDSISRPDEDGYLDAIQAFEPFVPAGTSYWEFSVESPPGHKASRDYKKRTKTVAEKDRKQSAFIFVTPMFWAKRYKDAWIKGKMERGEWKDIRVIESIVLNHWLGQFLAVELILAKKMGLIQDEITSAEILWSDLKMVGNPPPLIPELFLSNRDGPRELLRRVFEGEVKQIEIKSHYTSQIKEFVAAYIAAQSVESQRDIQGRCLIVSSISDARSLIEHEIPHVLILDFELGDDASTMLAKAQSSPHSLIIRGAPGGMPHPNGIELASPSTSQVEQALLSAGYSASQAKDLSQTSDGNLTTLLNIIQRATVLPEWSQSTVASDLAIAQFIGSWNEDRESDRAIVENLSGKAYGEWISKIRTAANLPVTPLTHKEKVWKFSGRYEAWFALGAHVYDSHLKTFKDAAVTVISEIDPKFELPVNQHYMASVHGKELQHSKQIRKGIATSLALLGSHPEALSRCSKFFSERTVYEVVYGILEKAEGTLWASLSDLLPLLAEASPEAFLKSVEEALLTRPTTFTEVFAQESNDLFGWNYISGLLWALESLAWNAEYLVRVISILGDLAALDPGGNWANRPKNSMWTILLPWKPHTCASIKQKEAAVKTLIDEQPSVGWQLLIDLIDSSQKITTGSFKPTWRSWIPDDWSDKVTQPEYFRQVMAYEQIAIDEAPGSTDRIIDVCDLLDKLGPEVNKSALSILRSPAVAELPDGERLGIWTTLMAVVSKHRKYADADWAMEAKLIDEIAAIAETLSPSSPDLLHLRLFTHDDFGLFEEGDNFEQQQVDLNRKRITAVEEVFAHGGPEGLLEFARSVESSWKLGGALGASSIDIEEFIFPSPLDSEDKTLQNFVGSFAEVRVRERGWEWFDALDISEWSPTQIGKILGFLPFTDETWLRVNNLLKDYEGEYWTRASVNPYRQGGSFEEAIDSLIEYGRPYEAVECLVAMLSDKKSIRAEQAIAALNSVLRASVEGRPHNMDTYHISHLIKNLQESTTVSISEMIKIEWGLLPLLEHEKEVSPKTLELDLATNPDSFCEVIRTMYKSKKKKQDEPTEDQKLLADYGWRLLNGWRIPPGTKQDGTFDGELFDEWLKKVKESCDESGHLEVALINIGQVLIHAPTDPSGLWIHASIAKALNAKDANDMRDGYSTAWYNSRGTHFVDPEGKPEMEIAEGYRAKAESVEVAGYHRLATTLKQLGNSYEQEAEGIRDRKSLDD